MRKPAADHPRAECGAAAALRSAFSPAAPLTVGVEDEVMLLDARTLDLAPRAREVVDALGGDPRFTLELPAAQLEIVLPPLAGAAQVHDALLAARRDLAAACEPLGLVLGAAGAHAFAAPLGELNPGGRYERMVREFGDVARAQLVFALQVHVCVRPADRAMRVYNALRAYLPLVAALAANAPLHDGRDTGLASVRPTISERLPRQGMPPALTWEGYAAALARLDDPAQWWWELRPHPRHGTLEVRVPDAQASVAESAAIVAVVHALVAWLAEERDGAAAAQEHDLDRDRALAYREGVAGALGARVDALLDALAPVADRQGASAHLAVARSMAASGGGAQRQRASFERAGARAAVGDLVERFLES